MNDVCSVTLFLKLKCLHIHPVTGISFDGDNEGSVLDHKFQTGSN